MMTRPTYLRPFGKWHIVRCPSCGLEARIDLDQLVGNVSIDCPDCPYHESHNLADEYLKQVRSDSYLKARGEILQHMQIQDYYSVFLAQNPDEPIPGTASWEHNLAYMSWIQRKRARYAEEKGLNPEIRFSKDDEAEFLNWLKAGAHQTTTQQ
jgi:hypothetical protein